MKSFLRLLSLAFLLWATLCLWCVSTAAAEPPSIQAEAHKLSDEELQEYGIIDKEVYGLFFSCDPGAEDQTVNIMRIAITYDSRVVQPYDFQANQALPMIEAGCFQILGKYADDKEYLSYPLEIHVEEEQVSFSYGCYAPPFTSANPGKQLLYVMFFKISENDESLLKKGSIKTTSDADVVELLQIDSAAMVQTSAGEYRYTNGAADNGMSVPVIQYPNSTVPQLGSLTLGDVPDVTIGAEPQTSTAPEITAVDTEGDPMAAPSVNWTYEPAEAPAGVLYNGDGTITVTKDAQPGIIHVTASADGITSNSIDIAVTMPDTALLASVELSADMVTVAGIHAEAQTVTAKAWDQDGTDITDSVTWFISGAKATDVSIDAATGVITIQGTAKDGKYTVTAAQSLENTASDEFTVVHEEERAEKIELSDSEIVLQIPTGEDVVQSSAISAVVTNQYGEVMQSPELSWSIEKDSSAVQGVTIANGVISVTKDAAAAVPIGEPAVFLVTASCGSVTGTKTVTITNGDSQTGASLVMERNGIRLGDTDTVVLPAVGEAEKQYTYHAALYDSYGSQLPGTPVWSVSESTDSHVRFSDGILTVENGASKDAKVTITATIDQWSKSVTVSMTDLEVDWAAVDAAMAGKGLTYGQKNSELTALPTGGTAMAGDQPLEGLFAFGDADGIQAAGTRQVTVVFTVTTDGEYQNIQVEKLYNITVDKKAITVAADSQTKTYGAPLPVLTFTVPDGALVAGDQPSDLSVLLQTTASAHSEVGDYPITGTATADNYTVTVTDGTLTVTPASVSILTAVPTAVIQANDPSNTVEGLWAVLNLPETVEITGAGTAATTAAIHWAPAAEAYNAKGGTYTYVGTLEANPNFANCPTVTATVTVTPVQLVEIGLADGELPQMLTVTRMQVMEAGTLADLGIPATVRLTYDNEVSAQEVQAVWDMTLAQLRALVNSLEDGQEGTATLTLAEDSLPPWATVETDLPTIQITITAKQVIPEEDITFAAITVPYGTAYTPVASVAPKPEYKGVTYTYTCSGSETLPVDAGQYTLTVMVENADYYGTRTTTLTILPKPLSGTLTLSRQGDTITATAVGLETGSYDLVWLRDGAVISGAAGTVYTIRDGDKGTTISAKAVGKGNYTGEIAADAGIAIPATVPDTPMVTAAASDGQVTVHWTVAHDGGSTITGYLLTIRNGDATVDAVELDGLTDSYTVTGLTNGTTYTFQVTASNAIGNSAPGMTTAIPTASSEGGSGDGGSSGGSSGGGTASNGNTETIVNPDGSITVIVTGPDGSRTETTKLPDGSIVVVYFHPNGQIEVHVTPSVSMIQETGGVLTGLPIPVLLVTADQAAAPTVTAHLPDNTTIQLEIPVEQISAGTVAILIRADGTEMVLRSLVRTETGILVELQDGDTVVILDNSKDFVDVSGDTWGVDAIDFTSSRELFNGTSETTFAPTAHMSRAMMVTVLARLDGVDTSRGATWQEAGCRWAVEQGISDGHAMSEDLTLEQLAVLLYRYSGSPAVTGSAVEAVQTDTVSSWATEAMAWAIQSGILSSDDSLQNAKRSVTRAEAAVIVMQYLLTD